MAGNGVQDLAQGTVEGKVVSAELVLGRLPQPPEFASAGLPGLPSIKAPARLPFPQLPGLPEPARDYVRPEYAERFRCIAGACEDTCCKGWSVPIDRGTYEKYRSHEEMKPHLGKLIVLNTNRPSTADYARMSVSGDAGCTFLDSEKMCGIQKKLGPEMLSATCATYPRQIMPNAGQVEKALNLSCPEATRLTLLDENLLGAGPWRAAAGERYAAMWAAAGQPNGFGAGAQVRLLVREFALLLLSDRSYPLWQRMYLLGILVRRLEALSGEQPIGAWCEANSRAVAQVLGDSARVAARSRLRATMDEIQVRPEEQISIVVALLQMRLSVQPMQTRFLECVQDFGAGLGIGTAQTEAGLLAAYTEGQRRYYQPLMDRHPQILENYVVNHIFKNSYPFGRETAKGAAAEGKWDAENQHLLMCVHLALIQTMLIGVANHYKEAFNLSHVVKVVQSLAKTVEHSGTFLAQVSTFVRDADLVNPHGIALLLRQDG